LPKLVALLSFAFFGYVERTSIAVAAERMMSELGITQVELLSMQAGAGCRSLRPTPTPAA